VAVDFSWAHQRLTTRPAVANPIVVNPIPELVAGVVEDNNPQQPYISALIADLFKLRIEN
jgi:hypothetical protein